MPKKAQDYESIKQELLQNGKLFEDPEFPACDESLFFSQRPPQPFQWKRPHELCDNPSLFVGGASRFDIEQGQLGDCWFLAALAALSLDDHLLYKVVPPEQSFDKGYAGIFKFNFWQYGEWKTIVIDDRLPVYNGRLVFVHSSEKNEFWSALLEKAYAKLHASYEALKGGNTIEAMEDFTGGVSESFELKAKAPRSLFRIMLKAYERDSQLGCSINAKPGEIEARKTNGLIVGHAYTMTDVKKVEVPTKSGRRTVRLVRLRNPWGQVEWNGPWSDSWGGWDHIPQDERKTLGLVTSDDGEFWMSFEEWKQEFDRVDICNLSPETIRGTRGNKKWIASVQDGRWMKGSTAGGCRNFPDSFWVNPQFQLGLQEEDDPEEEDPEDEDPSIPKTGGTFMIALMQKNRRKQMKMGVGNLTIGFAIYEYKGEGDNLNKDYFLYNASKARSHTFINTREISGRYKLPLGHYCVVPSTYEPNSEGDFLMRIYSLKPASARAIDEETGTVDIPKEVPIQATAESVSHSSPSMNAQQSAQMDAQKSRFKEFFKKLTGDDMEVDAWELQEVLNVAMKKELQGGGFSLESCKSMVALSDTDRNGKLGYDEFIELWMDLLKWKKVFKKFDADNSGNMNSTELRRAMKDIGYKMKTRTFETMVLRYADRNNAVTFDSYVACAIKLKFMFNAFKDNAQGNKVELNLDEFLMINMYS